MGDATVRTPEEETRRKNWKHVMEWVDVIAKLVALQSEAHKCPPSVGVFVHQEAVDLTAQREIGAVVADQVNAIWNPVVAQHVLGARQPVTHDFPKPFCLHFRRAIEVGGKGTHRLDVDLEEQSVFAAEVLEDGAFGDAELLRDIADARLVVSVLGEVLHGSFDDA